MSNTALTVAGFLIIFAATTAGSALVFLFRKELSGKLNTIFLGFASGMMVAALWDSYRFTFTGKRRIIK